MISADLSCFASTKPPFVTTGGRPGTAFVAVAVLAPFDSPLWARIIFGALGVGVPIAFLANHAAIRAEFDRSTGKLTITRTRPIGGVSHEVILLSRIAALEEVVETDADNTNFHRIELVLDHHGGEVGTRAGSRVALTTAPTSVDQSDTSRRLARWLDVPRLG